MSRARPSLRAYSRAIAVVIATLGLVATGSVAASPALAATEYTLTVIDGYTSAPFSDYENINLYGSGVPAYSTVNGSGVARFYDLPEDVYSVDPSNPDYLTSAAGVTLGGTVM